MEGEEEEGSEVVVRTAPIPPPAPAAAATLFSSSSRTALFSKSVNATLKSNALLLSAKFIPKNACLLVAGSTIRNTKFREESTALSTADVHWPRGTGQAPKISPLYVIKE